MTDTLKSLLVPQFSSKYHRIPLENYTNIAVKRLSYKMDWEKNSNLLLEYALKVIK